ncbi:MAG: methyltransferase domain-containing protein [Planctomycetota bacterium]|jgi:SAM-dependent methyltransferase
MSDRDEIRRRVSRAYAGVVSRPPETGSRGVVPKGVSVRLAGYDRHALAALPADAVANSCGCGDPLATSAVRRGDVVADLGCGAGIDLLFAAAIVGPSGRAIGVDMTDEMLAKARAVVAGSGLTNVEVRKGLIEDLPIASASVDWVISNCVINLSPEKDRVFAEIARVLKPGGRMLVSDIVAQDLSEDVRDELRLRHCCVGGAISEREYLAGLQVVGLVDVAIRERIGYGVAQLRKLMDSDRRAFGEDACCGGDSGPDRPAPARDLAAACEGRVWSANIFARRPR